MVMSALTQFDAERKTPWTALGTPVETNDVDQIMKIAGLDWEVQTVIPEVNGSPVSDFRAIERTDTGQVFGFQRKGYTPLQNRHLFEIVESFGSDIDVRSAGTFKGGARVWVQAQLHRRIEIAGDTLDPYLTISTSHDGSGAPKVGLGAGRLSCTNQIPMFRRTAQWSHRHSTNVVRAALNAHVILGQAETILDSFEEEVRRMIEHEVTNARFEEIVKTILPASDDMTVRQLGNVEAQRDGIRLAYATDRDGGAFAGSAWGVVNAVNSWAQWVRPVKSTSDRAERQGIQILDGSFGRLTERVAHLALV